jgi:hypothetical protein
MRSPTTPTDHDTAQLLVTLAWRLDGGQLVSADQMLATLSGIPTNDVAMASIVLPREVADSDRTRAPAAGDRDPRPLPHVARRQSRGVRPARLDLRPSRRDSASVLPEQPALSRMNPYHPEPPIRLERSLAGRMQLT